MLNYSVTHKGTLIYLPYSDITSLNINIFQFLQINSSSQALLIYFLFLKFLLLPLMFIIARELWNYYQFQLL